ncbi:MAG: FG-GAP-like repeat-containing protein, partial [Hyphomicrobiales bacterium]
AEFDGDGIADAVATDLTNGTLEVFHGNGDGTFTRVHTYPTGAAAHGLVIGDLNRDGNQDVVVANPGPGTVTVLLGHGDGTFTAKPDFTTSAPHTLNLGDLDRDGILDLLVVNFDTGTVTILRGVGDGTFVDPQEIPTGANAHGGAIADVDRDGRPDVLVANQTAGTLSVLMNRGGMTFAPKADFAVTAGAHSIAVADLDGDGDLDVAVSGITGNAVTIVENRMPVTHAARAWPETSDRKFHLRGGKPTWTVHVESADGAFRPEDVQEPVWLAFAFLGDDYRAMAMPSKSWSVGDADRDGVPDIGIPFSREALLPLFGNVSGRVEIQMGLSGALADGSHFLAPVAVELIGTGRQGPPRISPNPLNPAGTLAFTVDREGPVRIAIFDVRGRLVRRILDEPRMAAGEHQVAIDGKSASGAPLASGVYFFRIEMGDEVRSGRFAVLK